MAQEVSGPSTERTSLRIHLETFPSLVWVARPGVSVYVAPMAVVARTVEQVPAEPLDPLEDVALLAVSVSEGPWARSGSRAYRVAAADPPYPVGWARREPAGGPAARALRPVAMATTVGPRVHVEASGSHPTLDPRARERAHWAPGWRQHRSARPLIPWT